MTTQTPTPLDEQEVVPQEELHSLLITCEPGTSHRKIYTHPNFSGVIFQASNAMYICGKEVAPHILLKAECCNAMSQSNKLWLMQTLDLLTDYVEQEHKVFEDQQLPESTWPQLVHAPHLDMIPLDVMVSGYNTNGDCSKWPEPKLLWCLKNGIPLTSDEAVKVLADFLYDNDFTSTLYTEALKCQNIAEAKELMKLSEAAIAYGKELNSDDEWEILDAAGLYDVSAQYLEQLSVLSKELYSLLASRYEEYGILLVNTVFSFGFDEENDITLSGEVGTPNTSLLAAKPLYEKHGTLSNMVEAPILKYFATEEYDVQSDQPVPAIPQTVIDEVADTYIYLAEALSTDKMADLYL